MPRPLDWENLPQFLLDRVYLKDRTLGSIISPQGGLICKTLELPWKENKRSVSCIPEGQYLVTLSGPVLQDDPNTEVDESGGRRPRPYSHYIVHGVKDRSGILIHRGDDPTDSLGCLLAGSGFDYRKQPDKPTLMGSRDKLEYMTEYLPKRWRLLIEEKDGKPYDIK